MTTSTHIDPVCGMTVSEYKAAARHEHAGQVYYFCSPACLDKFHQNPAQFTAQSRPKAGGFLAKFRRILFGGCCSGAAEDDKPQT